MMQNPTPQSQVIAMTPTIREMELLQIMRRSGDYATFHVLKVKGELVRVVIEQSRILTCMTCMEKQSML